jgi:hypothetical protein
MFLDISDTSTMHPAAEAAKALCQQARDRNLAHLRSGATGQEVIRALKQYTNALNRETCMRR